MKFADIIERNSEDLANLETLVYLILDLNLNQIQNNGKPIKDSVNEDIPATISHIRYYAGYIYMLVFI